MCCLSAIHDLNFELSCKVASPFQAAVVLLMYMHINFCYLFIFPDLSGAASTFPIITLNSFKILVLLKNSMISGHMPQLYDCPLEYLCSTYES